MSNSKKKGVVDLGNLLQNYQVKESKGYVTREFQDFGYRLAVALNDMEHKSLYIKMAKNEDRGLLERALSFVSDAESARNKAKLFMWKFSELKKAQKKEQKQSSKNKAKQESLF